MLSSATALGSSATSSVVGGTYQVLIRGYYNSDGPASAVVKGDQVTITAQVRSDGGTNGTFTATCSLTGDHFSGTASLAGGPPMKIQGRVETADPGAGKADPQQQQQPSNPDAVVIDARIGATFVDAHGHGGRVSGKRVSQ
jgi:hypothetical protein